jgi:transcriptional regulator with PAS, ATPase and Fis domain
LERDDSTAARLVGRAPAIVRLRERLARVATSGLSLLVVGETGVGKELLGRELHRIGEQCGDRTGPFVVIDCANLPDAEAALESQFQLANHGTVFLAGINELSRRLQAKLLRMLEDREIVRVESEGSIPVDVRVIAAASSLRQPGELRADLYYRVCECLIEIPPLRARGSDVCLLADHFLSKLRTAQQLSAAAYQALERCAWPGNVRELESVIRRAALLHVERSLLGPECLFESPPADSRVDGDLGRLLDCNWEQAKEEFARLYWTTVWRAFAGNRRRIAEHARVSDVWLRSRRRLYELHDGEPTSGTDGESSPLSRTT